MIGVQGHLTKVGFTYKIVWKWILVYRLVDIQCVFEEWMNIDGQWMNMDSFGCKKLRLAKLAS